MTPPDRPPSHRPHRDLEGGGHRRGTGPPAGPREQDSGRGAVRTFYDER